MLWENKEISCMVISVLLLISSAFCLEPVSKGKSLQYGRLLINSRRLTNAAQNGIGKKLHDEYAEGINEYQADQPALRGTNVV